MLAIGQNHGTLIKPPVFGLQNEKYDAHSNQMDTGWGGNYDKYVKAQNMSMEMPVPAVSLAVSKDFPDSSQNSSQNFASSRELTRVDSSYSSRH